MLTLAAVLYPDRSREKVDRRVVFELNIQKSACPKLPQTCDSIKPKPILKTIYNMWV